MVDELTRVRRHVARDLLLEKLVAADPHRLLDRHRALLRRERRHGEEHFGEGHAAGGVDAPIGDVTGDAPGIGHLEGHVLEALPYAPILPETQRHHGPEDVRVQAVNAVQGPPAQEGRPRLEEELHAPGDPRKFTRSEELPEEDELPVAAPVLLVELRALSPEALPAGHDPSRGLVVSEPVPRFAHRAGALGSPQEPREREIAHGRVLLREEPLEGLSVDGYGGHGRSLAHSRPRAALPPRNARCTFEASNRVPLEARSPRPLLRLARPARTGKEHPIPLPVDEALVRSNPD